MEKIRISEMETEVRSLWRSSDPCRSRYDSRGESEIFGRDSNLDIYLMLRQTIGTVNFKT